MAPDLLNPLFCKHKSFNHFAVRRLTEIVARPATGSSNKYQRILDAAIEVIAEHGFFHARVSEIANRAGVADGTIYLYFKNKDELLMSAIDSAFHRLIVRARAALQELSDPRDKLRQMAFLHLEGLGSNRNLAIVFQTELRHSAKFLAQFSHNLLVEHFNLIKGVLKEGQERGIFRSDVPIKLAANCFFGAVDEMVTSWVLSDRDWDYPLSGVADVIVDIFLRGMESGANHGAPNENNNNGSKG